MFVKSVSAPMGKRILVVTPSSNYIYRLVYEGVLDVLDQRKNPAIPFCDIDYFFGNNNDEWLYKEVDRILQQEKYELVFTIGISASKTVRTVMLRRNISTPMIFSGMANPEKDLFLRSRSYAGAQITGVYGQACDYTKPMDMLARYMAFGQKRVVVLHSKLTMKYMQCDVDGIVTLLKQRKFNVVSNLTIDGPNSLHKLSELAPKVDLVVMPRDVRLFDYIGQIVSICDKHRVTLYASDIESVKAGAALGFGSEEYVPGQEIAHKAIPILQGKKLSSAIASEPLSWEPALMMNIEAVKQQKTNLKEPPHKLLGRKGVRLFKKAVGYWY